MIYRLFEKHGDAQTGNIVDPNVTTSQVQDAIRETNSQGITDLSDRNPANFLKDLIRHKSANDHWPDELKKLRITARQSTGNGMCFQFVRYKEGQTDAFPDRFQIDESTHLHDVESVSMPLESRRLGRSDEPWLTQVAVKLRLIETHLALFSQHAVRQVDHLQMSVKLRKTEIDALYLAHLKGTSAGQFERMLVCCESKQNNERILEEQVESQMRAAFDTTDISIVCPIAMVATRHEGSRGVHVVEFQSLKRNEVPDFLELERVSSCFYKLHPDVTGI